MNLANFASKPSNCSENGRSQRRIPLLKYALRCLLVFLFAAISVKVLAQGAEASAEQEAAWKLVMERCYLCHYLDRTDVKFGPSLKDLFKRPSGVLANGKPVNEQNVAVWIAEGSPNMPAFKHTLNAKQIQMIVTSLKEGRAANVTMIRTSR